MPVYNESGEGWRNPSPDDIRNLLSTIKTIAVIGLSSNPDRPSFRVAQYLQNYGYKIVPVNPGEDMILGERSYRDLRTIPFAIDLIDVFRRGEFASGITGEAITIGARAVWLQKDVISPEAFKRGEEAGLIMIMDRCILEEHRRFLA